MAERVARPVGRFRTTSIDTNVVVALWNEDEELNRAAQGTLESAAGAGPLVICGAVYAE